MSFDTELANSLQLRVNLVIKIETSSGDFYFSKNQVDSGLTIDADKIKTVSMFSTNPTQIDLRRAKQSVGSSTVKINDRDQVFSNFLGQGLAALINLPITLYVGLNTGSFDWSDYVTVNEYVIESINQSGTNYSMRCKSQTDSIQEQIYDIAGNLDSSIGDVDTSFDAITGEDIFAASGRIRIDNEFMQYTGTSFAGGVTTFTGVTRGDESSVAATHSAGSTVIQVEKITDNPINILLKIILSTGNGTNGSFDTLLDGAGVPEAKVDVTAFIDIRDQFFPADDFTLLLYSIPNALKYIETELLQANNLRLTEDNGLLSLAILDQSVPGATLPVVDESVISAQPGPTWNITKTQVVNWFQMRYFFVEGEQKYARIRTFQDDDSIALYGLKKGPLLSFKGIQSDTIASDRGNRYLNRFSTPFAKVTSTNFLKTYSTPVGGKVNFTHPDLPRPGGGLGLNNELELLKKGIDYASGQVKATYVFTSYANVKRGLIAPSDEIVTLIDQRTFTVSAGRGALYKTGWFMQLYDNATCSLLDDTIVNQIININGDTITFSQDFPSAAAGLTTLRFASYDDSSPDQTARYAYIVANSGLFTDGSGGYQIF